jgi:CDP-diacylglycerol--glycerol-3-phosphate 3-phosphatidyltransferase
MAWYFAGEQVILRSGGDAVDVILRQVALIMILLAVGGGFLVSYSRARAEGLGVVCKVGLMQRPERISLLVLGSLLACIPWAGMILFVITLFSLALLSNLTAIHRMIHVRKQCDRRMTNP